MLTASGIPGELYSVLLYIKSLFSAREGVAFTDKSTRDINNILWAIPQCR